jgi:hypothetical protein
MEDGKLKVLETLKLLLDTLLKKTQLIQREVYPNIKALNLLSIDQMVKFVIVTVMEMTRILQKDKTKKTPLVRVEVLASQNKSKG